MAGTHCRRSSTRQQGRCCTKCGHYWHQSHSRTRRTKKSPRVPPHLQALLAQTVVGRERPRGAGRTSSSVHRLGTGPQAVHAQAPGEENSPLGQAVQSSAEEEYSPTGHMEHAVLLLMAPYPQRQAKH